MIFDGGAKQVATPPPSPCPNTRGIATASRKRQRAEADQHQRRPKRQPVDEIAMMKIQEAQRWMTAQQDDDEDMSKDVFQQMLQEQYGGGEPTTNFVGLTTL